MDQSSGLEHANTFYQGHVPQWRSSGCGYGTGCIPYPVGAESPHLISPWVSTTHFIPCWVMKLREPMRRNIAHNDHESLNHHSEASPCIVNQSSHRSGIPCSAHMPFLQIRQFIGHQVFPGLWAGIPQTTCIYHHEHSHALLRDQAHFWGSVSWQLSKRIHDLYPEGSYQWHTVVIFLFRKQEE